MPRSSTGMMMVMVALMMVTTILFCVTTAATEPTMSLNFHRTKPQVTPLDFSTFSPEQLSRQALYLIKAELYSTTKCSDILRPVLIDFIQPQFLLVQTSAQHLVEVGNQNTGLIDGIVVLPTELRLSHPVKEYLTFRQTNTPTPTSLQLAFDRYQKYLSGELRDEKDLAGVYYKDSEASGRGLQGLKKSRKDPVETTTQPLSQDLSQFLSSIPDRTLNNQLMFEELMANVLENVKGENQQMFFQQHPNLSVPLQSYLSTLPTMLQGVEDIYHHIEADFGLGQVFQDPQSFREALNVDTYTLPASMASIGPLTTTATQSFVVTVTKEAVDWKDRGVFGDAMTRNAQELLSQLETHSSSLQSEAISSFLNGNNSNLFELNGFGTTFEQFATTFDQTYSQLTKSQPQPASSQSKPTLTTLFPFNIALQHSLEPINAIAESEIAMNNIRVQFQSPLFISNATFTAEVLHTRLVAFETLLSQIDENLGSEHAGAQNLNHFETILDQISEILAEQYHSQIFTPSNRHYIYSPSATIEKYIQYDTYLPGYNIRAHLVQHIDAIIITLYKLHNKNKATTTTTPCPQSPSSPTAPTSLPTQSQLLPTITSILQHQTLVLNEMVASNIETILAQYNTYQVELDQRTALFNNYARFALQLGLDNIAIAQDVPTDMSYTGPYQDAGLNGRGVIVSVCDSGSDYGSCYLQDTDTSHAVPFTTTYTAETKSTHRKYKSYLVIGDKYDYLNGHGTHVSGSVAASCSQSGAASRAVQNGALPAGMLAFVDFAIGSSIVGADFAVVFQHAVNNGAIITSNSWGTAATKINHISQNNMYTAKDSRAIDQLLSNNHNVAALFAASNDGVPGFGTLTPQAVSKNSIVLGSTQSSKSQAVRSKEANKLLPSFTNTPSAFDNLHNLYGGSSSMGPTFDQRIKPDFVAPGTTIASVAATEKSSYSCGWTLKTGTSMATPTSAGLWGIMQQILLEGRINSGLPKSSHAYAKESIGGPFLRALAMNAAQRINFRSNYAVALPQPMKTQKAGELPTISIPQDGDYDYAPLGANDQIDPTAGPARLYFRPTRTNPFVTSTERVIKLMVYFGCKSESVEVEARVGDDTQPTGPVVKKTFVFETGDADERDGFLIPMSSNQQLYLKFSIINPACSAAGNMVTFATQEFIGSSYETAQRYQDATCSDKYEDFPEYASPNFSIVNRRYIRCPPSPACTDNFDQSNLYGNRHFSTNSSICRAALHAGAMNMTLWDLKDQQEAQQHILHGKREMVVALYAEPTLRPEPPTKWYGVSSKYLNTAAIDPATKTYVDVDVFGFEGSGEPLPKYNNYLNYLRVLPPHQNFASGYGLPKLSSIFPLTQHVMYKNGLDANTSVQRFAAILRFDAPTHSITDQTAQSYCVRVSSKPLTNTYKTATDNGIWTSGEDSFRVSLAWYDVPGSASTYAPVLVNDLDLFVYGPDGSEYRGNQRADHLNNGERVDLLQGTFTPGMYCSVVSGVNVPVGPQRFGLVAHGRGLEYCLKNPFKAPLSGIFVRDNSQTKCQLTTESFPAPLGGNHNFSARSDDPEASIFHQQVDSFQVRSGGDCFSIHDITFPSASSSFNAFNQQRLSSTKLEDAKDWEGDSIAGKATIQTKSRFVISGRFDENGRMTGETYRHINTNPTYDYNQPIEDQIIENPTTGKVNSVMMEDNVEFDMAGQMGGDNKTMTIILQGLKKKCIYVYNRQNQYGDVQY